MKRFLVALLLISTAHAQTAPSPAQVGIQPGASPSSDPATLSVLDPTKTWALMGTVDPVTHQFTAAGSSSGGGGASTAIPGAFQDGWSVTHGFTTDPACTSPTAACSLVALTRAMWNAIQSGVAAPGAAFPNPAVGFAGDGSGLTVPVYEADGPGAPINVSAAGTVQIVLPPSGKRLFITGVSLVGTGTGTTGAFKYGTQTTTPCDTASHPLTGAYPPGAPVNLGGGLGSLWALPTDNQLCLTVVGTSPQYSGFVAYTSAP